MRSPVRARAWVVRLTVVIVFEMVMWILMILVRLCRRD